MDNIIGVNLDSNDSIEPIQFDVLPAEGEAQFSTPIVILPYKLASELAPMTINIGMDV